MKLEYQPPGPFMNGDSTNLKITTPAMATSNTSYSVTLNTTALSYHTQRVLLVNIP
jgi:hypothetical protein